MAGVARVSTAHGGAARLGLVMRISSISLACLALAGLLAGCATVAPYQRGYLSRPSMDFSSEDGETSFRAHVHDSREGATGGHGSTGGGCGCN